MLILTCATKLQLLESVLQKSLPQTLPVCGAVMHINRGNPAQHEVVVDSWPEFKVVLTRPRKEVVKENGDYYTNLHAAFYWDIDACQSLLENKNAIDWGRAFQLQGLQDGLYKVSKSIAEVRRVELKPYFYQAVLHPDPSTCCPSQFKSDLFHYGTLNSSHVVLINETWSIGGNHQSLRYLNSLICNFPSACLLDKEGQLASWTLSDPLACLTHSYTLPQYRGHRCNTVVGLEAARKMHAKGFPAYGGVLPDNKAAKQGLMKYQGFHTLPFTKYVLFFTPGC
ncbi:glycine N-acyltransferase-like protein 3 isoform X1 [Anolis carolinensis]|uniref:glycine N-acyltransferase-like protein 3 isoform X1 n=1 Tax=Anolis carolinensis TaxID=28377 RepID=UPI002F2B60BB